ncbi:hypothetical protein HPB49_006317 [Dermacentor silvarum]|uniref:Uncharacterized protein n=1 Tax=Dermacentor silvarum TaxID=543639 RepID=A0ACB8CVG0_DERSI|nr:hypothetical protein HPB49_006317 [Dermacentor silvarum]
MADHHSRKRRRPAELGPPPRWLNCPRKGALIAEKFLPFKTPLSEIYDAQVPEESRFPPSMLLDSLTSYKLKMGLWIDLTNTDRFYDPKVIEQREIRYLKLQCRGHGECPSQEQTDTFIGICQRFISMNPLHIIGVHCTHGFNRTGFLIASYLVVNMSWSIEAAVKALAEARPPGIYKADYLRELFKRYGDVDDTPPPPPRPSWCDEENEDLDDDGNALGGDGGGDGPVHKRRRREFTKKNPTFMEGVSGVVPVTTQPKLLQIQRRCQELCHWERYMMLIDGENEVYFIDRDNCVFQVSNLYFPRRKDRTQHIQETLVDGEMIIDEDNGRKVPRYLIYDIIRFQGEEVWGVDFCRRLTCISRELYEPRKAAMQEGRINRDNEPFGVRHKQFWDAAVTYKLLSDKFAQSMPHELDGLIFQPKMDVSDPCSTSLGDLCNLRRGLSFFIAHCE